MLLLLNKCLVKQATLTVRVLLGCSHESPGCCWCCCWCCCGMPGGGGGYWEPRTTLGTDTGWARPDVHTAMLLLLLLNIHRHCCYLLLLLLPPVLLLTGMSGLMRGSACNVDYPCCCCCCCCFRCHATAAAWVAMLLLVAHWQRTVCLE